MNEKQTPKKRCKILTVPLSIMIRIACFILGTVLGWSALLGFLNISFDEFMSPSTCGNAFGLVLAYFLLRAGLYKGPILSSDPLKQAVLGIGVLLAVIVWWVGSCVITFYVLKPFFGKTPPGILLVFVLLIVASSLFVLGGWILRVAKNVFKQRGSDVRKST